MATPQRVKYPTDRPQRTSTPGEVWPPLPLVKNRRQRCVYGSVSLPAPAGIVKGREVQRVITGPKGRVKAYYIEGWPGPIPYRARLTMPPVPHHAVWGPQARTEARRLLRLDERFRRRRQPQPLTPFLHVELLQVRRGERPLTWWTWSHALSRLTRADEKGRPVKMDRPMSLTLGAAGLGISLRAPATSRWLPGG
jgi:hypothetical protein